jgi:hypothetical protein
MAQFPAIEARRREISVWGSEAEVKETDVRAGSLSAMTLSSLVVGLLGVSLELI